MSFTLFLPTDVTVWDHIARVILLFNNKPFIAFALLGGFLAFPRMSRDFGHLILLAFFSMILNTLLKYYFAVPLPEHLDKDWYAFPSGHLQFGAVFYGWMILIFHRPWVKAFLAMLLGVITWATIHCGYHDLSESLAGLGVGFTLVGFYWIALGRVRARGKNETNLGLLLTLCAIGLMLAMTHWSVLWNLKLSTWMAFYLVLGFSLTWRRIFELNVRARVIGTILGLAFMISLDHSRALLKAYPHAIQQLPFLVMGLGIPLIRVALQKTRA